MPPVSNGVDSRLRNSGVVRLLRRQPSSIGGVLFFAYRGRLFRPIIRILLKHFEGGIMHSHTWRRILRRYEGVDLGQFSYGPGIRPGLFEPGTKIGSFSSFADGLRVLRRNHTAARFSQHPLFFNPVCGLLKHESRPGVATNHLTIGSDVWTGLNVIICPSCKSIGNGAIIGAGAVVTKDVPPFTVMAGNPAKPIRKRFSPEAEAVISASEWWLRPLPEIVEHLDLFTQEITGETLQRFVAAFPARSVVRSP